MHILITGRSGTGKSTISRELKHQGYNSVDIDRVPGLCGWINPENGQSTAIDYTKPLDRNRAEWRWNVGALKQFLADNGNKDTLLCGSAHNQLENHKLFDKVFVLTLPPAIHKQRIMARTEHSYGQAPGMPEKLIGEQAEFVSQAVKQGAITVDATPQPDAIVKTILAYVYAR